MTSNPARVSSKPSPDDRRRRNRLAANSTPGWIITEGAKPDAADPWMVRVTNVSRNGVGFESFEKLTGGQVCRIRIGRGPLELARRIRIVRCAAAQDGSFTIGGEFF